MKGANAASQIKRFMKGITLNVLVKLTENCFVCHWHQKGLMVSTQSLMLIQSTEKNDSMLRSFRRNRAKIVPAFPLQIRSVSSSAVISSQAGND